jgi:probable rRNA maturation factor
MNDADPHHPDIDVLIDNRQDDVDIDEEDVTALAVHCLGGEGVKSGELSVSFVTPDEMEELHVRFVGEEGPTDVLSFPQDDEHLLGDVVICPEVAAENDPDVESEIRALLVHGILHLLGYDHEEDAERAQMWARQEHYLEDA